MRARLRIFELCFIAKVCEDGNLHIPSSEKHTADWPFPIGALQPFQPIHLLSCMFRMELSLMLPAGILACDNLSCTEDHLRGGNGTITTVCLDSRIEGSSQEWVAPSCSMSSRIDFFSDSFKTIRADTDATKRTTASSRWNMEGSSRSIGR